MAEDPDQAAVTAHFREMAEGKVTDADMQAICNTGVGGRYSRPIVYRMGSTHSRCGGASRPVADVTSDVVQSEDMAASRLGRASKLRVDADGDSIPANLRRSNISSSSSSTSTKQLTCNGPDGDLSTFRHKTINGGSKKSSSSSSKRRKGGGTSSGGVSKKSRHHRHHKHHHSNTSSSDSSRKKKKRSGKKC